VVLRAARGDARRTHPLLWVVALLFVVYFAVGPVTEALS
jgi:AGZA family xanthine/uracil permease-like MFS transporter